MGNRQPQTLPSTESVGFVLFRRMILGSEFALLLLAVGFFAGPVFVDLFVTPEEFFIFGDLAGGFLSEDGLKLLGVAASAAYFWRVAMQTVRSSV